MINFYLARFSDIHFELKFFLISINWVKIGDTESDEEIHFIAFEKSDKHHKLFFIVKIIVVI